MNFFDLIFWLLFLGFCIRLLKGRGIGYIYGNRIVCVSCDFFFLRVIKYFYDNLKYFFKESLMRGRFFCVVKIGRMLFDSYF